METFTKYRKFDNRFQPLMKLKFLVTHPVHKLLKIASCPAPPFWKLFNFCRKIHSLSKYFATFQPTIVLAFEFFFRCQTFQIHPFKWIQLSTLDEREPFTPENGFSLLILPLGVIWAIGKQSLHSCFAFEIIWNSLGAVGFMIKTLIFMGALEVIFGETVSSRKFLSFD